MLIEFSIANFRSFDKRQYFSMASSKKNKVSQADNVFSTGLTATPFALRSVCILGPNASGKSNFVKALAFMRSFVSNSARKGQVEDKILIQPFRLRKRNKKRPSEFEIVFIHKDNLYQYGFSLDEKRVWEEWLFKKSLKIKGKLHSVFERKYIPDSKKYFWKINRNLKGNKEVWKASTRENALFLSTAVQLKSESLRDPFDWFNEFMRPVPSPDRLAVDCTIDMLNNPKEKGAVIDFIKSVDIQISDFNIEEVSLNEATKGMPKGIATELRKQMQKEKFQAVNIKAKHNTVEGGAEYFDLEEDESDGTNVLFGISGPILDTLKNGYTVIFDELSNSLHPFALRYLVNLFHNKKLNKKGAQLIFTSHDVSVIHPDIMQRDQIWFIEKNQSMGSELFPLSDFKPRKNEIYSRGYLGGRYGALPKIKGFI